MLFQALPEEIFKPLVGKYRTVYAFLLTRLHAGLFSVDAADQPEKSALIEDLEDGLGAYLVTLSEHEADEVRIGGNQAYVELRDSGWFIEQQEGWTIYVEMAPAVSQLLDALCCIGARAGETFGGTIVTVLNDLEMAAEEPDSRAVGVQEAAKRVKNFARYLRGVIGVLRCIENSLLAQADVNGLVRTFFDEFVERIVVGDYRTLTTKNNPYMFRQRILSMVMQIQGDAGVLNQLVDAYLRLRLADTREQAEGLLDRHLLDIELSLDAIERFRQRLDRSKNDIESRFSNTLHYMDLLETGRADRFLKALSEFGAATAGKGDEDLIDIETGLLVPVQVFDENALPKPDQPRPTVEPSANYTRKPDPLWIAFEAAKRQFDNRMTLTPARFQRYLEDMLADAPVLRASDIPPTDVEEFAIFSALRMLPETNIRLRNGIIITQEPGQVESDWIICGDFTVRRQPKARASP